MGRVDTILVNGRIWCGLKEGFAEALSISGDRVLATGSEAEIRAAVHGGTEVIDLQGRLAVPGLNDAHTHFLSIGLALRNLDIRPNVVGSVAEIYDLVAQKAAVTPPGQWIVARGYDPTKTPEMHDPTRVALDAVAPDHPVMLARTCGHVAVVNSKALELAGLTEDVPDPDDGVIGRDEAGRLNGFLAENARDPIWKVMPKATFEEYLTAIEAAGAILLEQGITSTMDAAVGREGWHVVEAYLTAKKNGMLSVRITACLIGDKSISVVDRAVAEGITTGAGDDMFRIGGVKFFTDGSGSSGTAAMSEPYLHVEGKGVLCLTATECIELARHAHSQGFQLVVHAIGDVAIDQILDAIEIVQAERPREDIRHRIEHCGWVRPEQIERLAKLKVIPSPQPNFIYFHGETYIRGMGVERSARSYPMRSFLDAGLCVPASTDCPTAPLSPFQTLYGMVARKSFKGSVIGAEERISMAEALHAYTYDAAYASHDENIKGRLVTGQYADIAVLSKDLFAIDPEEILDTQCDMTLLGGKVVYLRERAVQ